MTPLITVKNLGMAFNGTVVLKNINFKVAEGETVGIIGRSGAGKTVLMHLMRGVDQPPTEGAIIYHVAVCSGCDHVDVPSEAGNPCPVCGTSLELVDVDLWAEENATMKRRIMRRTAIMFQRTFALYGDDRVIENVLRALDDVGYPGEKAVSRAADLIDQVRLSHRMMHIARDLSGGEKQRVVLARQLAKNPFVLFADEPTGTLDPETATLVHRMLIESARTNDMGMIVTSHFSNVIEDVADRAIFLENGEIKGIGDPREVIDRFMEDYSDVAERPTGEVGEKILVARDVIKRYLSVDRGVVRAVNSVSFEVAEKEIFGIIGKSGAGKTTLSRIISGILEPTSGEMNIRIGDEWIDMTKPGIENRGRAKSYIGLLHQEYDLYPHRTVLDNLTDAIGLEFPKELTIRKTIITLNITNFTPKKNKKILKHYPQKLSKNKKHQITLTQILIHKPLLIILNKPTKTINPITKINIKHSILHTHKKINKTFIIISHNIKFIKNIYNHITLIQKKKIIQLNPTNKILTHLTKNKQTIIKNNKTT